MGKRNSDGNNEYADMNTMLKNALRWGLCLYSSWRPSTCIYVVGNINDDVNDARQRSGHPPLWLIHCICTFDAEATETIYDLTRADHLFTISINDDNSPLVLSVDCKISEGKLN